MAPVGAADWLGVVLDNCDGNKFSKKFGVVCDEVLCVRHGEERRGDSVNVDQAGEGCAGVILAGFGDVDIEHCFALGCCWLVCLALSLYFSGIFKTRGKTKINQNKFADRCTSFDQPIAKFDPDSLLTQYRSASMAWSDCLGAGASFTSPDLVGAHT